jgi:hypothetical protein
MPTSTAVPLIVAFAILAVVCVMLIVAALHDNY